MGQRYIVAALLLVALVLTLFYKNVYFMLALGPTVVSLKLFFILSLLIAVYFVSKVIPFTKDKIDGLGLKIYDELLVVFIIFINLLSESLVVNAVTNFYFVYIYFKPEVKEELIVVKNWKRYIPVGLYLIFSIIVLVSGLNDFYHFFIWFFLFGSTIGMALFPKFWMQTYDGDNQKVYYLQAFNVSNIYFFSKIIAKNYENIEFFNIKIIILMLTMSLCLTIFSVFEENNIKKINVKTTNSIVIVILLILFFKTDYLQDFAYNSFYLMFGHAALCYVAISM